MNLLDYHAKICLTAAGVLIHNDQVLLVKHKKLGIWLNPGGHIEADEAPHQAAEREFWEETQLKTKARFIVQPPKESDQTEFMPDPFLTNLHWVSQANYQQRQADPEHYQPLPQWKRGCEQHLNFVYLMELVGKTDKYSMDPLESTDIRWFTEAEISQSDDIKANIKAEILKAFELNRQLGQK